MKLLFLFFSLISIGFCDQFEGYIEKLCKESAAKYVQESQEFKSALEMQNKILRMEQEMTKLQSNLKYIKLYVSILNIINNLFEI